MVHLTNDYRKLLRRNGPKAALSLCVALALSGGLVSAEGKTYDDISPYGSSREALEGDPIEVVNMGSGDGDVQAGTDETNKVIVHILGTYKDKNAKETPNAFVKGRMIEILGDLGNSGGGKVSIGGDMTDSVDIKGILNNNNNSDTVVNGTEITSGYTGNWGGFLSIGNDKTKSAIMDGFGSSNKAKSLIQGGTISTGSLGVWGAGASFKADREFKVAKDGNTQDIGVTNGGTLSVTAGSVEAGRLSVSGIVDPFTKESHPSKINFHAADKKGIYLSGGLFAFSRADVLIDSNIVQLDSRSETDSSGRKFSDSINSTDSTISIGRDGSQITLNGRLYNAGSNVTLNGRSIHISAVQADDDGVIRGKSVEAHGDSVTYIGNESTRMVDIDGKTNTSGNAYLAIHGRNISLSYAKGIALSGYGGGNKGEISIGGAETDSLTITGQVSSQGINRLNLSGEHITVDSTGYDGSESTQFPFSESLVTPSNDIVVGDKNTKTIFISSGLSARNGNINVMGKEIDIGASSYFNTHEIKSGDGSLRTDGYIAYAADGNVNIGGEDTNTVKLHDGQLLAGGADITVQGKSISIANHDNWAGYTLHCHLNIGTNDNDSIQIQGGIHTQGGGAVIQGKQIAISSNDENRYALDGIGGDMTVGGLATESIDVDGGIHAKGCTISLEGKNISISKGKQENAIYTDGGTVSIKATSGNTAHISGPIRNKYGNIDISLTGRPNHLDSQIITTMYGTRTKLTLSDKASWSPQGEATYAISDTAGEQSNLTSYVGNDGILYLDNQTKQTITVRQFDDNGSRIHEDIYGSKNTGNDAIHIDESYKGNTHFWLVNRDDTDKGVVGTILASAGNRNEGSPATRVNRILAASALNSAESTTTPNISQFTADHFVAYGMSHLFFKTYGLATQKSSVQKVNLMFANQSSDPNAPDNPHNNQDFTAISNQYYDQDLIITGVTNHTTNEHGQYTPTVSTALSGSSLMYYTWRTENDKMLQRVGDLRENEGEETGLWARIRGSRIGKSHSDRGFKNQYKVYEIGYDAKTEDNDRMKSFTGIAFSYLDGKGYYTDGRGTNQAASAAIYHTDIHKTGHYLDLVFRIRHMNERLHTHTTVDADIGPITEDHSASMDTTGLSFSAEYGRKKFVGNGWYVEPQTQWTLGYLGPNQYEMDNGTRVEQPGITSFVGRVGFNLGRQVNPNSIVYLKANVYHEFGGHSPIHLYAGDESMSFTDTFDDTWFEYGVGFAMKLGSRLSLYGDFEKSAGSHFYKDWQWNAGIRYSF